MFAVLGIILLVAGAVLAFAVDQQADGVNLVTIGWILMAGGAVAMVAAQVIGFMSMSKSRMRSESHVSSDGRHVVEETETA